MRLRSHTREGVECAFEGIRASGGTSYAQGVRALKDVRPGPDQTVLYFFIGDEQDMAQTFHGVVQEVGHKPEAFGLLRVVAPSWGDHGVSVRNTANNLGIPCFLLDLDMFDDVYAVPRVLRNLIMSTPVAAPAVGAAPKRKTLIEQISETDLLEKPAWAA